MESVLLSSSSSYLKMSAEKGSKGAIVMMKLKQNIDKPLSAILSLNTVSHTVGAAGVGSQATLVFGEAYFGLASAILTILILVFTEIIPKSIGARFWKELIGFASRGTQVMIVVTYPMVIISAYITKAFSKNKAEQTTSREEISALANIGTKEGILEEKENLILQNLIQLKRIKISEIMTPRIVVSIADENMLLNDFLLNKDYLKFSRIPLFSENEDNITGYVFVQTVFEKQAELTNKLILKDIKRKLFIVPETMPVYNVWEILLEKKEHIALIVDEYGQMAGIVTLEDIIETLFGIEIIDEKDTVTDMQQYAREQWKIKQKNNKSVSS
jgi:CBS domain containing-hemolysin-like protein